MFAETHKIIASNVYQNIEKKYEFKLDKKKMLRWSVAPDILPQYRLIGHYRNQSIDYIIKEIAKTIYISRYLNFNDNLDPLAIKILSKKIGLISHYISDYFCLPHAKEWTFYDDFIKHVKYELELEKIAKNHIFDSSKAENIKIDLIDENVEISDKIKIFIDHMIFEYLKLEDMQRDLDFAVSVNTEISYFIIDTIKSYSPEIHQKLVFQI